MAPYDIHMPVNSEFDAMVQSLGESAVGYIGKEHLRSLSIIASPASTDASVVIVPIEHTPAMYDRIIDAMIELRAVFMGELSIDYAISDEDDRHGEALSSERTAFVAAV